MKFFKLIFLFLIFLSNIKGQVNNDQWLSFTSPLKNNDILFLGDILFSATEGGLFVLEDNKYETYTTVDGLEGVNISSIACDLDSNLWIGGNYPYGFLQVYDPRNKKSINIFDFGLTEIVDIKVKNQYCWVQFNSGQDNGLMKFFKDDNWKYIDIYKNYPQNVGNINCFEISDSIAYIGSNIGIFFSKVSDNMKDPNNWSPLFQNFNTNISSMEFVEDTLQFTTDDGIFYYHEGNDGFEIVQFGFQLSEIKKMINTVDGFIIAEDKNLYLRDKNQDYQIQNNLNIISIIEKSGYIYVGTEHGFLIIDENRNVQHFIPNAPVSNNFSAIEVLKDGRIVCGSGKGLSIYNGSGWRNILEIKKENSTIVNSIYNYDLFIADTVQYDFGEYIADIEEGPDGLIYCSIRGSRVYQSNPSRYSGGIIAVDIDNPNNISVIDTSYLSYFTTSNNSVPYQVVLDINFDKYNNMWVANPYCINGNEPIHVRSMTGDWNHFKSLHQNIKISQSPISIDFDLWDRVWFSSFQAEEANLGIYPNGGISFISFDGDPSTTNSYSYDVVKFDETVWSLGMGKNNRLYFLTPSGLNYYDINGSSSPISRQSPYPFYPNISFGSGSGIKIDYLGNIWTYSNSQGIHVLLENTSYWPDISGIRTSNSYLLSDEIRDIDFDEENNLVYIATSQGINALRIPFGKPKENYNSIKIYPSPFYIPSSNYMRVSELTYNSSMLVMTLDGKVVRKIKSQGINIDGDQLMWDGRDSEGDYVSSGVYLLAIYGDDGSNQMTKITVIKK